MLLCPLLIIVIPNAVVSNSNDYRTSVHVPILSALKCLLSSPSSSDIVIPTPNKFKDDKHKSLQLTRKYLESYIQHGIAVEDFTLSWNAFMLDDDNQIFDTMKQLVIKGACCYGMIEFCCGFPLDLCTSNTLTTLDLSKCNFAVDTSESIKFPSLINLTLIDMELNSAIINKTFLSGSPLVESVNI
ncbi:hypothetical protein TIFTF001_001400 [Ficus carica]|uniref:Uncharacterized protein n=1 Tax=Ficus carica TaxID=3494 RepID=A0AA88CQ81_FICCA|nr:hypothetical protein TIFTF001_001400 [Ficus carica]